MSGEVVGAKTSRLVYDGETYTGELAGAFSCSPASGEDITTKSVGSGVIRPTEAEIIAGAYRVVALTGRVDFVAHPSAAFRQACDTAKTISATFEYAGQVAP